MPAIANETLPAKLMPAIEGVPPTAAKSGDGKGTLGRAPLTPERAALAPPIAAVGGGVGKDRPERARGEVPPWKSFTLDDGKLESRTLLMVVLLALVCWCRYVQEREREREREREILKGRPTRQSDSLPSTP